MLHSQHVHDTAWFQVCMRPQAEEIVADAVAVTEEGANGLVSAQLITSGSSG